MNFEIADHYTFVKFDRESYPPHRPLPLGYSFGAEISRQIERSLLEPEFQAWSIPFNREMPGSRPDGVLSIHYGEEPIAIVFLCDQNELALPGYGQLHYAAIRADHRERGLYGPLFSELARISDRWGLKGLLINGDRVGLPEVYRRWGGKFMFEKPKSLQAPPRLRKRLMRRLASESHVDNPQHANCDFRSANESRHNLLVTGAKRLAKRATALTPYEVRQRPSINDTNYDLETVANRAIDRIRPNSMVAREGLITLYQQVAHCETAKLSGALVECGVWKGGAAALMAIANLEQGPERRPLHLFDSFVGIPEPIARLDGERAIRETVGKPEDARGKLRTANDYSDRGGPGSEREVRDLLGRVGYSQALIHVHQGWFQETVPSDAASIGPVALLRLDGDLYESTKVCLEHLYGPVVSGGFIVIDDYGAYEGCRRAVDEFLAHRTPRPFLNYVNSDIRYLIKP